MAQLFDSVAPKVKSDIMRKSIAPNLVEDLAVETFVNFWPRAVTFNPDRSSAATWIYTIARNTYVDGHRRDRPDSRFPLGTVKTGLQAALKRLRAALGSAGEPL